MPQPPAPSASPPVPDPPAPRATPAEVAAALAALPRYYGWRDLQAALGGQDAMVHAYCQGWLNARAVDVLELVDPARLQCWLLQCLVRLTLQGQAQAQARP